jgi:hypothetical protein
MKYKLLKDAPFNKAGTIFEEKGNYLICKDTNTQSHISNSINFPEWFAPVDEWWKPTSEQNYWYVTSTGEVNKTSNDENFFDNQAVAIGNCFPTKEQAIVASSKLKDFYLSLHKN